MATQQGTSTSWFQTSRDDFKNFPCNLSQTDLFQYSLDAYRNRFIEEEDDHFDDRKSSVSFWDLFDHHDKYQLSSAIKDTCATELLLKSGVSDPCCRFIFIMSDTNRKPLNCSREQLALMLSHHQVMAPFLDRVFTFSWRDDAETATSFQLEDSLDEINTRFAVPELGRSGLRFQHCFNLVSVEADNSHPEWLWSFRQTAMHHSFDIVDGKAFWMSLKGNEVIKTRITESTQTHSQLKPGSVTTVEQKFVATLLIHLLLFQWCVEGWPGYIDFLQDQVSIHSVKVKFTPVAALTMPEPIALGVRRKSTMNSSKGVSRQSTFASLGGFQAPKLLRELSGHLSMHGGKRPKTDSPKQPAKSNDLDLDEMFKFTELQKLSQLEDDLKASLMVIEQDIKAMNEIMEHYRNLLDSPDFRNYVDTTACLSGTTNFFTKGRLFVHNMENYACRLKNVAGTLENAKSQFYGILQYRNMRTSEYFAQSAYDSAKVMEDIAITTKQETVSMHAITILTLVFLPGTFVAILFLFFTYYYQVESSNQILTVLVPLQTVFGSGLLNWDENGGGWVTRKEAVVLFFAVLVPITVVTLGGWLIWYRLSRPRAVGELNDEEAQLDDEKKGPAVQRSQ